eukprot:gnl/MRDRNA2_/MRDRNA2_80656_c1_seq1.p1 gnl/MRDRNA2_/MRDRNA2_80656_c1~~gnl/MRDRNA2_/MRDRNA2_80656_c1_seq1.p1  ORF type:complete len:355 (-),score=81.53 gnl/MRDRNA2_/MRDRNA2_80656_c1_seq1:2-1066(-)
MSVKHYLLMTELVTVLCIRDGQDDGKLNLQACRPIDNGFAAIKDSIVSTSDFSLLFRDHSHRNGSNTGSMNASLDSSFSQVKRVAHRHGLDDAALAVEADGSLIAFESSSSDKSDGPARADDDDWAWLIDQAFTQASIPVKQGFKLSAWEKAIKSSNLEKVICSERRLQGDCLSSVMSASDLFIVMDVDDDDDEVHPEDIIPIVRMLTLLKKKKPCDAKAVKGKKGERNEPLIKALQGVFDKQSVVSDPDGVRAVKFDDMKKVPKDEGLQNVFKQFGNLQFAEAITKDASGELFAYLLDVDQDNYIHSPDFVPCVRALTRIKFEKLGCSGSPGSKGALTFVAFMVFFLAHLETW